MKPLAFRQVRLTNFKNHANASFEPGPRFNLVHGLNGTGKTNLLDTFYYLAVGKSYFTSQDQKIVRQGESFFRLDGLLLKGNESHELVVKVRPGSSKEILLDNIPRDRVSDHLGFIPVVISAPKDIDLVTGQSQVRRKYFDHLICQLDHDYLKSLMTYNQLLALRNAALKQGLQDLRRLVATYDEQMLFHASVVYEKRKAIIEEIQYLFIEKYEALSDGKEQVEITYDSQLHEKDYSLIADQNWEHDKLTQRTNGGIHKDDFDLMINGLKAKDFGSQGQVKSIIFSLHLSKYILLRDHLGFQPLLILDDIFDKLDDSRLTRLMELLLQPGYGQILLSDTSAERVGSYVPAEFLKTISMSS